MASTPIILPDYKYVTISGDSSSKRPSIVENLNNLTKKAKEVGRRGTKRKALLYEGPTVCRTESPKKVAKVVQKEDTTGNFEEQIEVR